MCMQQLKKTLKLVTNKPHYTKTTDTQTDTHIYMFKNKNPELHRVIPYTNE